MNEWETFCDISYYHLWRVRRKDERGFNDGYHLQHGEEAKALVELLNRLERERVEVSKDLEFRRELYKVQEQYLEKAIKQIHEEARDYELQIRKLCEAYNDLGEQNAKLRDIAEKAIVPLECDGVPWGAKLRAELDQLKQEGAK
jgi:hypothetical protein